MKELTEAEINELNNAAKYTCEFEITCLED